MELKLEFTRETSIPMYYAWLSGYIKSSEILGLDMEKVMKTFAIKKGSIIKGYTQLNNINIQKEKINKLEEQKLKEIIKDYLNKYEEFEKDKTKAFNKKFLSSLMSGFVITFILGDMLDNKLQSEGYNARIKTEKIMYLLSSVFGEGEKDDYILTADKKIPISSNEDIVRFLKKSNIKIK